MNFGKRDITFLLSGALVGYGLGYAICWWRRPLPQLANDEGKSLLKSPATTILLAAESIRKFEPLLKPLAAGEIPAPRDIYNAKKGVG
jgi:hypothetical protein